MMRRDARGRLVGLLLAMAVGLALVLGAPPPAAAHSPHDDVGEVVVSPSFEDDQTIFVVVRAKLLRSVDGGRTFQEVVHGLGRATLARLAISTVDGDRLYLTSRDNGVYRSDDGGSTWQATGTSLDDTPLQEVAASTESADLVYVAGSTGGLHRSEDGGDTWTSIDDIGRVTAMRVLEDGSDRLVVAEASGRISTSDDGGRTWTRAAPPADGAATAIAADPAAPGTVVAATADGRLLRSEDAGASFDPVTTELPSDEPRGLAVSPDDPDTLWLSTWTDGAFRSDDGGRSWEPQPEGLTKSEQADQVEVPHFRAIRTATRDGETVLFLGGFDGLFRSDDGGERWEPVETQSDYIAGLALSPNFAEDRTVAVMTYVKGGFLSEDAGETWAPMNGGLGFDGLSEGNRLFPLRRAHNVVFSPAYADDRTIFSATWPRLIRSVDGGETWTDIAIETATDSPLRQYVLAVSPAFATDRTVFAGNRHGQVFRSEAGGDEGSWSEISTVDGRVRSIVPSPDFATDRTVFLSSVGGVFMSTDAGETWTPTGPTRSPLATGAETDPAPLLAMSPDFPTDGTVFAGTESGLFVTRDAGAAWSEIGGGPIGPDADVVAVNVSPDFSVVLVSVRADGLYRSTDGGETFSAVAAELIEANRVISDYDNPTSQPIQFSPAFADDDTVFAYAGGDVLRSSDGGGSWEVLPLPTVAEVAELIGFDLAATEPEPAEPDTVAEASTGRRTFDTPLGVLSVRRVVAAGVAAAVALAVLTVLHVGRSERRWVPWALRGGVAVVVFVAVAAVLAA